MVVKAEQDILLVDRSGAEVDDSCKMKYWMNRLEGGIGIVNKEEALALKIGRETHEDMAVIAEMENLSPETLQGLCDDLLKDLTEDDKRVIKNMEMLYRRMGWFVAWALYMEPKIRERYENVGTEKEIILDRTPLWVPVTPDRVLKDRKTGQLEYREYKTTISASKKWLDSWQYAIQLHLGLAALVEELNTPIKYAHIVGLMKGMETDHLHHPYVWAWYNHRQDKWSCEYQRGGDWVNMPVWDYPGGMVKWVQFCGEDVAKKQFPHSPPVTCNYRMLEEWVYSRTHRMKQIKDVHEACRKDEELKLIHFPRTLSKCRPGFGDQCPYVQACWNAEINNDPLGSGVYVERTPHHDVEMVGVEDE